MLFSLLFPWPSFIFNLVSVRVAAIQAGGPLATGPHSEGRMPLSQPPQQEYWDLLWLSGLHSGAHLWTVTRGTTRTDYLKLSRVGVGVVSSTRITWTPPSRNQDLWKVENECPQLPQVSTVGKLFFDIPFGRITKGCFARINYRNINGCSTLVFYSANIYH